MTPEEREARRAYAREWRRARIAADPEYARRQHENRLRRFADPAIKKHHNEQCVKAELKRRKERGDVAQQHRDAAREWRQDPKNKDKRLEYARRHYQKKRTEENYEAFLATLEQADQDVDEMQPAQENAA